MNFQAFVDAGTVSPGDLNLFKFVDTPKTLSPSSATASPNTTSAARPRKKKEQEVLPEIAKTRP